MRGLKRGLRTEEGTVECIEDGTEEGTVEGIEKGTEEGTEGGLKRVLKLGLKSMKRARIEEGLRRD